MNAALRIILATTSEYDAQVIDAAHGEALKLDLERDMDMDPLGHPKGFLKRDQWDPITRKPKVPADTGADQFFRCTATAAECLADGRAGIDGVDFALLLEQYADSKAPDCYPLRDRLVAHIDAHCAQQVAVATVQITESARAWRYESRKHAEEFIAERKVSNDLRAQLAARIEPAEPAAYIGMSQAGVGADAHGYVRGWNDCVDAAKSPQIAQPAPSIPDVLFDGYAVLQEANRDRHPDISPEHVSAVLDAAVRLIRGAPKQNDGVK